MIKQIILFSIHNKFLVLLTCVILLFVSYYSMRNIHLDAIPDLSDTQVIIYSRWDRSPDIIEDQVTYPIITSLLGVPKVRVIRGLSDFGYSYIYVIFHDGTDIYWARSRVMEYLSKIQSSLPQGVKVELGPDATGVGWVFQYALVDKTGKMSLSELRSFQDFKLKYALNSVPGVSEVASIGGFQKQYQITIKPQALQAYNISMESVINKVKESNEESGARLVEYSSREYMVRGRGYIRGISDIENISLGTDYNGTPILLKNIANVSIGPDIRRGLTDLDGNGNVVGGIVVMRHKENALNIIEGVKSKLNEIQSSLPHGVEIVTTYDRSSLILNSISNLKEKLVEEMVIVSLIILLFLWHFPSAIIPIMTIPISVIISFVALYLLDINANIMSLSGIAISIGVLVDGAIVEVENAYKKLEKWKSSGSKEDYHIVRMEALTEVGPSVFFSLLVIAVAFMPVFTLVDQEGRLFKPLAYSKNISMAIAAVLAITLDPAFRMLFTRMEPFEFKNKLLNWLANILLVGKYYPEEQHPVSKVLFKIYEPVCKYVLEKSKIVIGVSILLFLITIPLYFHLGSEFMPPLYEESMLYMPTTLPGISISEAEHLMVLMDKKIKSIPEVERVFGKAGRADTSTDNAPLSMMETVILLKPQKEWRKTKRFYSGLPSFTHFLFRPFASDTITKEELIEILDKEMELPGVSNAWTMPIKARIDMLSTGLRTPVGVKIQGSSLEEIEKIAVQIESELKGFPGIRSIFAERTTAGFYLDIELKRDRLARYNISIQQAQDIIFNAIGGQPITQTIEGRERYTINLRYPRELRDDIESLKRVLLPTSSGGHIPISEIAELKYTTGASMIRDENGFLTGYVYIDPKDPDIGGFVEKAKEIVKSKIQMPAGYIITWTGQYENMLRVRDRMKYVIPLTIAIIFILIYLNTKSYIKTAIVLLAVPFSVIGAVLLLYFLGYQISVAVWVGMIALMGLDAETGIFMLMYMDLSYEEHRAKGKMNSLEDLKESILEGAVKRIRPKIMTVMSAMIGLLPIMWSSGTGSDMMKRIAAPMVGGLVTSFILELLVYPPIYYLWKKREFKK